MVVNVGACALCMPWPGKTVLVCMFVYGWAQDARVSRVCCAWEDNLLLHQMLYYQAAACCLLTTGNVGLTEILCVRVPRSLCVCD